MADKEELIIAYLTGGTHNQTEALFKRDVHQDAGWPADFLTMGILSYLDFRFLYSPHPICTNYRIYDNFDLQI